MVICFNFFFQLWSSTLQDENFNLWHTLKKKIAIIFFPSCDNFFSKFYFKWKKIAKSSALLDKMDTHKLSVTSGLQIFESKNLP